MDLSGGVLWKSVPLLGGAIVNKTEKRGCDWEKAEIKYLVSTQG